MSAATFQRRFVRETPEFIERQRQVLDARRAEGMNVVVLGDDGRILRIAPDGTETDVTAELDREVAGARKRMGRPA
jgi:hypothetical protein